MSGAYCSSFSSACLVSTVFSIEPDYIKCFIFLVSPFPLIGEGEALPLIKDDEDLWLILPMSLIFLFKSFLKGSGLAFVCFTGEGVFVRAGDSAVSIGYY